TTIRGAAAGVGASFATAIAASATAIAIAASATVAATARFASTASTRCAAAASTRSAVAPSTRGPAAAAPGLAHDDIRGAFHQRAQAAAVAVLVAHPVCGLAVDEHRQTALGRGPCVGPAAGHVDPRIIDAQRRALVDVHVRRALDRRAD